MKLNSTGFLNLCSVTELTTTKFQLNSRLKKGLLYMASPNETTLGKDNHFNYTSAGKKLEWIKQWILRAFSKQVTRVIWAIPWPFMSMEISTWQLLTFIRRNTCFFAFVYFTFTLVLSRQVRLLNLEVSTYNIQQCWDIFWNLSHI